MSEIIDIISKNDTFYIVIDSPLDFKYERKGKYLIAEDSGFFRFYGYKRPVAEYKAFGGRKFGVSMKDGTVTEATGQWWDTEPEDYCGLLYTCGVATLDELKERYVFRGARVDRDVVNAWLTNNQSSENYNKYRM
jgi:hypothetical protein